jgi:hypothetical protein
VKMVAPALKKALFVTSTRIALMGLMRSIVVSYQRIKTSVKILHRKFILLNAAFYTWWKETHKRSIL